MDHRPVWKSDGSVAVPSYGNEDRQEMPLNNTTVHVSLSENFSANSGALLQFVTLVVLSFS